MLVDNGQQQQPYSFGTSAYDPMSDFLNMDLFGGPSSSPSSRDSSSPNLSFSALLTPPQQSPSAFPAFSATDYPTTDSFFNFALDDEFTKLDAQIPAPSPAPFDFLGAFNRLAGVDSSSSSSSSSSHSPLSATSPPSAPMLAIDPQLVGTPATSRAMSEFGGEEEEEEEEAPQEIAVIAPVKVAGHGKLRKGTVQGGGVTKKSSAASGAIRDKENNVAVSSSATAKKAREEREKEKEQDEKDDMADDWRPSPEEYKKMSSKEKRQLRNKISARNFRVRRKEYISTLEGDIAERDKLLDAIRSELGSSQSENIALRQEISALKKALLSGRGTVDAPVLPPPAPLPAIPAAVTASAPRAPSPAAPLRTANTQKDLPNSPRLGARGFWGGAGVGIGAGGITPVHTALMPDWTLAALTKLPTLQENLNPALNNPAPSPPPGAPTPPPTNFDSFVDVNPFTVKALDAYRMQLWGKMAAQHHAHQQSQAQQPPAAFQHQPYTTSGLAQGLRPLFFASSTSPKPPPSTLSGKPAVSSALALAAYPSPPPTPRPAQREREQQATIIAALASQTLLQRLGGAFWDAFAGTGAAPAGGARAWDADKVRRVLEGRAVVRVVDVEERAPAPAPKEVVRAAPVVKTEPPRERDRCLTCVTDILEESMRSLSIAKKT